MVFRKRSLVSGKLSHAGCRLVSTGLMITIQRLQIPRLTYSDFKHLTSYQRLLVNAPVLTTGRHAGVIMCNAMWQPQTVGRASIRRDKTVALDGSTPLSLPNGFEVKVR